MLTLLKVIIKGFLIMFIHLRYIEEHLGMHSAARLLDPHITEFRTAYEKEE